MNAQHQNWIEDKFSTLIRPVTWSPDGKYLVGGGDDGVLYLWDSDASRLLRRMPRHYSRITSVTWNPDGTRLASGGSGQECGELFVWDPQNGERVASFAEQSGMVSVLAWGSSDEIVISGGGDGMLCWWDIQSGKLIRMCKAHEGTVQSLKRSPDETKLASCGDDGSIMLWDLHTGDHLKTLRRDRPYKRLNITGIKGLTEAQKAALRALGAVDNDPARIT